MEYDIQLLDKLTNIEALLQVISSFIMFFIIVLLCWFAYKFFRIFF